MGKYRQGFFKPKNPQKYKGDPTQVCFRSQWECAVMQKFDIHPDIIEWSSEGVIVPYISPKDGKMHRYFIDFYVKYKDRDGNIQVLIIEVKPEKQTKEPVRRKNQKQKSYITEVMTWGVNKAKWTAAEALAKKKGWRFVIWTEKELGLKKK